MMPTCKRCGKEVESGSYCEDCSYVVCSCCGKLIPQEENVDTGHGQDIGFGMCKACGGDPAADTFRKKIGWGLAMFYDARMPIIRAKLTSQNQVKWDAMAYEKRCFFVSMQIKKGRMI